jgi:hypothetical protein
MIYAHGLRGGRRTGDDDQDDSRPQALPHDTLPFRRGMVSKRNKRRAV